MSDVLFEAAGAIRNGLKEYENEYPEWMIKQFEACAAMLDAVRTQPGLDLPPES